MFERLRISDKEANMPLQRSPRVLATLGLLAAVLTSPMLAPVSSSAGHLIVEDLESPGDGLIIRDPATGLEWLKVTATLGLSINDVLAHPLTTSGAFRYATESEVQALFAGSGLPLPGVPPFSLQSAQCASAVCVNGAREIIQKFGTTNTQTPIGTLGFLDPDITAFNNYSVRLSSLGDTAIVTRFTESPTTRLTGAFGAGSWLVRADGEAENQPPVAVDDEATLGEGETAVIDVLANDFDPDGDDIAIVGVTQGEFGTVVNNDGETVSYSANVLGHLMDRMETLPLNRGLINSLRAKVQAAQASFARGNRTAGFNQLGALVNELEALVQSGWLDGDDAGWIIAVVQQIEGGSVSDTFTYTISDGALEHSATVFVSVSF